MGTIRGVSDAAQEDRLLWTVRRTEQAFHAAKERALRDVDVHPAHYGVLKSISHMPDSSASALARNMGVTAQTASTLLARLETRGAVQRRSHPRHRHVVEWALTPRGAELLAIADERISAVERHLRAGLDPEDVRAAQALLDAAREAAAGFAPERPAEVV